MNARQANKIPITSYLSSVGISPVRSNKSYSLYLAPYRDDKIPSLKVSHDQNLWVDYGNENKGGTLIDLVLKLNPHYNVSDAIRDIYQTINSFFPFHQQKACCQLTIECRKLSLETRNAKSALPVSKHAMPDSKLETPNTKYVFGKTKYEIAKTKNVLRKTSYELANTDTSNQDYINQDTCGISIIKIQELGNNQAIVNYLNNRGIQVETASPYCKEFYYRVNGKRFFGLANENINGWSIRNKYWKGCTAQGYSYYPKGSHKLNVFEGIFDLLSYAELHPDEKNKSDFIVLNSLVNIKMAIPILKRYQSINLYQDHDEAGRRATQKLLLQFPNTVDKSNLYKPFKDLNEYYLLKVKACREN